MLHSVPAYQWRISHGTDRPINGSKTPASPGQTDFHFPGNGSDVATHRGALLYSALNCPPRQCHEAPLPPCPYSDQPDIPTVAAIELSAMRDDQFQDCSGHSPSHFEPYSSQTLFN